MSILRTLVKPAYITAGPSRSLRTLATSSRVASSSSGSRFDRPGPPPLPKKEQEEFNRLVKERGNQLQFNRPPNSSVSSSKQGTSPTASASASSESEELHPNARQKPTPDFEGEANPLTGEVGGPKKDPLKWEREWTYGGRATDF